MMVQLLVLMMIITIASTMLPSTILVNANHVVSEQLLMKDIHLDERDILELKQSLLNLNDKLIITMRGTNNNLKHQRLRQSNNNGQSENPSQTESSRNNYIGGNLYDSWKIRHFKGKREIEVNYVPSYEVKPVYGTNGDTRNLQSHSDANSSLGWVPSSYPNPINSPDLCHIPDQFWMSSIDSNTGNPYVSSQEGSKLLMCDPDNIMSIDELNEIGNTLVSFNLLYSQGLKLCDDDKYDYDIGVLEEWRTIRNKDSSSDSGKKTELLLDGLLSSSAFDKENFLKNRIEIGVALANKLDIDAILNEFSFYTYEDEESMTDDAAQFFASILHSQWFNDDRGDIEAMGDKTNKCNTQASSGILVFLSIEDRVCFISSGNSISYILPWWRLEHVVINMKDQLRQQQYKDAIIGAIVDIAHLINEGPPTVSEKLNDFSARFGIAMLFSLCTFILAVYGELRERRKKFEFAESSTCLNEEEKEKARILQHTYKTSCCPICLEDFNSGDKSSNKETDSLGIPLTGSDNKPLKMLRCGHIFCLSCWRAWVYSGNGNPKCCPVCRQDVSSVAAAQQTSESREHSGAEIRNYGAVESSFHDAIDLYERPIV